jgi:hypothetical protein
MEINVELGESAIRAFMALAKLFEGNDIETVTIKNPEIQKMREAVESGKETTAKVQEGLTPPVPTSTRQFTMEELGRAGAALADSGKVTLSQIQEVVASFGVSSLSQMEEKDYDAFAAKLRELGADL